MTDDLLEGLRRFQTRFFPRYRRAYRDLVAKGQRPRTLFIGCSDSRLVPYLLTGAGPGELFVVRNVGNFIPPWDASHGFHGTTAAIEFAVQRLNVRDIVVCGHSHCGAIEALYGEALPDAPHLNRWLDLARDAALPVTVSDEALRRTEQRSIALQLSRLLGYPMVARRVEKGELFLHGWYYVIEEGRVLVLDVERGTFETTDIAPAENKSDDDAPSVHQLQ
jgi:carbonic anhydrase